MTLEKLYQYISLAVERNIIVYDCDNDSHVVTKRLLALLKTIYSRNTPDKMTPPSKIYIPNDDSCDDLFHCFGSEIVEINKVYGVEIIRTDLLNKDGPAVKFYAETCNGYLDRGVGIVLAVGEKDSEVLLGKY